MAQANFEPKKVPLEVHSECDAHPFIDVVFILF